jgi:hypothetical protein
VITIFGISAPLSEARLDSLMAGTSPGVKAASMGAGVRLDPDPVSRRDEHADRIATSLTTDAMRRRTPVKPVGVHSSVDDHPSVKRSPKEPEGDS